jgi:hypothetical protein
VWSFNRAVVSDPAKSFTGCAMYLIIGQFCREIKIKEELKRGF